MQTVEAARRGDAGARVSEPGDAVRSEFGEHDEIEWQLEAPDLERVRVWLCAARLPPGITTGRERLVTLVDRYYDTADRRFHRAGYALRVRRRDDLAEVTLKALAGGSEAYRRRRELTAPIASARALLRAPAPVGERVRAVAGRRRLRPLFEIHTHRRIVPLSFAGAPVGEVALDETVIPRGGGRRDRHLARVEIEARAAVEALEPFVATLRAALALAPATESKFEAALAAHGLGEPPVRSLGATVVDAAMTIGAVAFAALRRNLAALAAHEPGTRLGDDPEALHDMRVATRRLRAALRTFADVLPPRARELRDDLALVGATLGAVRDLDVHLAGLDAEGATAGDDAAVRALRAALHRRRVLARRRMLRVLDSRRYERLVAALRAMVRRAAPARPAGARAPVLAVAPDLITHRYRTLRRRGDPLGADAAPADYHALRIRCKHLRYALEFHADVYGKPARALLRRLVALQDLLGAHQDAEVAATTLRALVAREGRSLPVGARAAAETIAAAYEARAPALRVRVPKAYRKIRGRRWKRLREAMARRRPAEA